MPTNCRPDMVPPQTEYVLMTKAAELAAPVVAVNRGEGGLDRNHCPP